MNCGIRIVREARALVGVSFRWFGRTDEGLDCAGLIFLVMKRALGIDADFVDYPAEPSQELAMRMAGQYATSIEVPSAVAGDIVLMRSGLTATHFGVLTPTGVIHVDRAAGHVIEEPLQATVVCAYRLNGAVQWPN